MTVTQIITYSGVGILLVLSFIKIKPIEINFWGILGRAIGRALNAEVMKQINSLDDKISTVEETLNDHIKEDELDKVKRARLRILRFNYEVLHGQLHTEEQFNEIIEDIDFYINFCNENENYPNMKANFSIENIRKVYEKCAKDDTFLR